MINIENLSFSYQSDRVVLKCISLAIKPGEKVGLIGPNGAGKSTLFKSIVGLYPAEGTITIDGICLNKKNLATIRKKVGIVLQDSDNQMFMPTVIEDMIFGPVNYGMSREEAVKKAESVLEQLELTELMNRRNHRLSCGEKRMAAIATIFAMSPEVILMDEPSSSLDPYNRRRLINMLNSLDVTQVIATHDLDLVLEVCDKVILMYDGRIVASGATTDILRDRELLEKNRLELPLSYSSVD